MKKIATLILLIVIAAIAGCCPNTANAQTKAITIDTTGMPAAVKQAIVDKMKQDVITDKIESYGKWVGFGKEVGVAAREGLTAVKDVALDIANSKLGSTIMFLIIWKVAGIDFVRIGLATLFSFVSIWLISRSYFRLFNRRKITERTGWWIFGTRKYSYNEIPDDVLDGIPNSWAAGLHWFFLCIMIGISALIAFA